MKYDGFLRYLVEEIAKATGRDIFLHDEALIECLVKHKELTNGPLVWSPMARLHLPFDEVRHGYFSSLSQKAHSAVKYTAKLLPLYCRLCFLADCHERAESSARVILSRLKHAAGYSASSLPYETRAVEYLIDNLSATPPREWGEVARSPDVSVDAKVAVDLLWSHLTLVYAGNRRLLLYNIEQFFSRQQNTLTLCPVELRAALFAHGRHEPVSKRNERYRKGHLSRRSMCPVEHGRYNGKRTVNNKLYESRLSRLCWLGALWLLDFECNRIACHWLHNPEPYRDESTRSGYDGRRVF